MIKRNTENPPDDRPIQVAHSILERIMSNQYLPGTFLPSERELQEEYQVSRTMIREAIKQLSARGLLITTPRQGTLINPDFVGPATDSVFLAFYRSGVYMEDIWETRFLLEPHIAELAW